MSWGTELRIEFGDILGLDWRIDIESEDYAGSITPMQAIGEPLRFNFLTNSDNIYEFPIKGSTAEFTIYSDTNFQWAGLFSIYDLQYRVSIYNDTSTLLWRGFITPWQHTEPYDAISYPVTITASDSLGFLKNIYFTSDGKITGTPYTGRRFESQIIFDILGKIQITEFYEFINMYETAMDSTTADSPLDQSEIDCDVFLTMNCYDVLEHLLKKYNAIIRQKLYGQIIIYRPTELINTTVYGRKFTAYNTKIPVETYPTQLFSREGAETNMRDVEGGTMLEQGQAALVEVNQDYGNKDSWLDNWQFKGETFTRIGILNYSVTSWSKAGGCTLAPISTAIPGETEGIVLTCQNAYPTLSQYIYQSFGPYTIVSTTDHFCIEFDYLIYNASGVAQTDEYIYVEIKSDSANKWIYAVNDIDCAWSNTYTRFEILVHDVPTGVTPWVTFKRNIPGIPTAGSYTVKLIALDNAYSQIYVGFRNFKYYVTSELMTINYAKVSKPKWYWGIFVWGQRQYPQSLTITDTKVTQKVYKKENDHNGITISIDSILGDCADTSIENVVEQFQGSIAVYNSGLTPSATWSTIGNSENLPILQIKCNEIAWQYKRTKQLLTGLPILENNIDSNIVSINLIGNFQDSLNKVDGTNRIFVFSQGSFNARDREWSVDLIEVIPPASIYVPPVETYEGYGALYNWYAINGQ